MPVPLHFLPASAVLTVERLEFRADRSNLVNPDLEWNKRYADYKADYPRWNDVIICLQGPPEDRRIDELARHLAQELRAEAFIMARAVVFWGALSKTVPAGVLPKMPACHI